MDISVVDFNIQTELGVKLNKNLEYRFVGSYRHATTLNEHKMTEDSNVAASYRAMDDQSVREANDKLFKDLDNPDALPVVVLPKGGLYNRNDNTLKNFYLRNTINFNKTYDEIHSVNILAGQEVKYSDRQSNSMMGFGYQYNRGGLAFTDYRIIQKLIQEGGNYFGMKKAKDRFVAFFANGAYSYKGKYTFYSTVRVDGSNQLGKAKKSRWLPTWNVSGKWNVKQEDFLIENDKISHLAVRGTYGLTASMGPARNSSLIITGGLPYRPYSTDRESGMYVRALENSELTWEKMYETNIGIDLGLFGNKVSFEADVYWRNSFDLIAYVPTSGIGGSSYKFANYADMKSHGFEFSLSTKNISGKDFSWTTNLTFAKNENEITNLKISPRVYQLIQGAGAAVEGSSVRSLYSIPFAKLDSQGLPLYYMNGKNPSRDNLNLQSYDLSRLVKEGPTDPKITGGFGNVFKYKNLRLNVFLTYQFGNVIRLNPVFKASYNDMDAMSNVFKNRWMMAGDENRTNIPAILSKAAAARVRNVQTLYNAYNFSDQRIAKGDFIRLKEISLSYNLPKSSVRFLGFNNAQLKLQATNLFLLYCDDKLNGQDPEFFGTGGVAMPSPKQFTFTLKLGL